MQNHSFLKKKKKTHTHNLYTFKCSLVVTDPADKLNTSQEAVSGPVAIGLASKVANNTGEQKATQEKEKDVGSKKTEDESDVVKAIRKRREDMANKEENKMKEVKERWGKEVLKGEIS